MSNNDILTKVAASIKESDSNKQKEIDETVNSLLKVANLNDKSLKRKLLHKWKSDRENYKNDFIVNSEKFNKDKTDIRADAMTKISAINFIIYDTIIKRIEEHE